MEYLLEFKSFFKKIKKSIEDQKHKDIDPTEVVYDIEDAISYIKDNGFKVEIKNVKVSAYTDEDGGVINLPFDRDFFFISISDSSDLISSETIDEDSEDTIGFNTDLIKDDLLGFIDYMKSKYTIYRIDIKAELPKEKSNFESPFNIDGQNTGSIRGWVAKQSKSVFINIDDIQNKNLKVYSLSIRIII